jgi:hypothetical protein
LDVSKTNLSSWVTNGWPLVSLVNVRLRKPENVRPQLSGEGPTVSDTGLNGFTKRGSPEMEWDSKPSPKRTSSSVLNAFCQR